MFNKIKEVMGIETTEHQEDYRDSAIYELRTNPIYVKVFRNRKNNKFNSLVIGHYMVILESHKDKKW